MLQFHGIWASAQYLSKHVVHLFQGLRTPGNLKQSNEDNLAICPISSASYNHTYSKRRKDLRYNAWESGAELHDGGDGVLLGDDGGITASQDFLQHSHHILLCCLATHQHGAINTSLQIIPTYIIYLSKMDTVMST